MLGKPSMIHWYIDWVWKAKFMWFRQIKERPFRCRGQLAKDTGECKKKKKKRHAATPASVDGWYRNMKVLCSVDSWRKPHNLEHAKQWSCYPLNQEATLGLLAPEPCCFCYSLYLHNARPSTSGYSVMNASLIQDCILFVCRTIAARESGKCSFQLSSFDLEWVVNDPNPISVMDFNLKSKVKIIIYLF